MKKIINEKKTNIFEFNKNNIIIENNFNSNYFDNENYLKLEFLNFNENKKVTLNNSNDNLYFDNLNFLNNFFFIKDIKYFLHDKNKPDKICYNLDQFNIINFSFIHNNTNLTFNFIWDYFDLQSYDFDFYFSEIDKKNIKNILINKGVIFNSSKNSTNIKYSLDNNTLIKEYLNNCTIKYIWQAKIFEKFNIIKKQHNKLIEKNIYFKQLFSLWKNNIIYYPDNIIKFNEKFFKCIKLTNNFSSPENNEYWTKINFDIFSINDKFNFLDTKLLEKFSEDIKFNIECYIGEKILLKCILNSKINLYLNDIIKYNNKNFRIIKLIIINNIIKITAQEILNINFDTIDLNNNNFYSNYNIKVIKQEKSINIVYPDFENIYKEYNLNL